MPWYASLITLLVGVFMILKTQWIYDFTGPIEWAERTLGTEGGTHAFIKILGVLLIIGTFLTWTGLLQRMLLGIFGSVLP